MLNTDMELMNLQRKAQDVAALATARGWDLPTEYREAQAVVVEAGRIAANDATLPPAPKDARKVEKYIADGAKARLIDAEAKRIAASVIDTANRDSMRAILTQVATYIPLVCDEFDKLVADFNRLTKTAPHSINGHTTAEEFEAHAELLRTTDALTSAAHDRGRLALATAEADDIGPDGLWLILEPAPSTFIGDVRQALSDFSAGLPSTLENWDLMVRLGLRMARAGDVAQRRERYNKAVHASALAPDRGMIDKTYSQALAGAA